MKKDNFKELNFEMLLLLHLNRIGKLAAQIMGEAQIAGGTIIHHRIEDKEDAIKHSVLFFEAIIPRELRQKYPDIENELNNCSTDMEKIHTFMNLLVYNGYFLKHEIYDDFSED